MKLNKTLSSNTLIAVFLVSIIINMFFNGALVDVFTLVGFLCLIFGVFAYLKEKKEKKMKKGT